MNAAAELIGARVRRIDAPSSDLWTITLVARETRGTLLISLQPGAAGVGWAAQRPHGLPATSFVQKLRKELEGGRVVEIAELAAGLELSIARAERVQRLVFDFDEHNVLLYADSALIASAHKAKLPEAANAARAPLALDLTELEARGAALLESRRDALFALRKAALLKALRAAHKRLSRKLSAISGDAARANEATGLRERGQLLLANLHAVARGATTARVIDYSVDPPAQIELALDPTRSAREQAETWFKRARRYERGAALAAERLAAGAEETAALEALEREIDASETSDALEALVKRAEALGIRSELPSQGASPDKSREPARHVPYKTLYGAGERAILVGKGAEDNDVLTREHARPHDLWLHARDVAGAHVVVPLARGEVCPNELLLDAAHLAAHFSDARGESAVDVCHTPRRYVRKPKGAAPGLVVLEREKVVHLQIEAARLARLLQSERG